MEVALSTYFKDSEDFKDFRDSEDFKDLINWVEYFEVIEFSYLTIFSFTVVRSITKLADSEANFDSQGSDSILAIDFDWLLGEYLAMLVKYFLILYHHIGIGLSLFVG